MSTPNTLTRPQIQERFNKHLRECAVCKQAFQSRERQLCLEGQLLATMMVNKLKGAKV